MDDVDVARRVAQNFLDDDYTSRRQTSRLSRFYGTSNYIATIIIIVISRRKKRFEKFFKLIVTIIIWIEVEE